MTPPRRALAAALAALTTTSCGAYFVPVETPRVDAGHAQTPDGAPLTAVFHGCTADQFVDRTAAGAERVVTFGTTAGVASLTYAPKCMAVAAGQSVVFQGAFMTHPLAPGTSAATRTAGSPNNPISDTAAGSMLTVRFAAPGTYPYFCTQHLLLGMAGVVEVRP